jgi:hypothetical protein
MAMQLDERPYPAIHIIAAARVLRSLGRSSQGAPAAGGIQLDYRML